MIIRRENRYRVFATEMFAGNPVTLHETDALDDADAMRQRARLSWSEDNGFFVVPDSGPILARFFSSQAELFLCGHGLLALAHHLAGAGEPGTRSVQTPAGTWALVPDAAVPAVILPGLHGRQVEEQPGWIRKALAGREPEPPALQALHVCPNGIWVAQLRDVGQLQQIDAVRVASQDVGPVLPGALIAAVPLQEEAYAFRYFAPWHGKLEDSGTGSAHCYLAPLFLRQGDAAATGEWRALQCSPQGLAEMRVALLGNAVRLAGTVHAESMPA